MLDACEREYLGGFSLANTLTLDEGVPWRQAQVIAGRYIVASVGPGTPILICWHGSPPGTATTSPIRPGRFGRVRRAGRPVANGVGRLGPSGPRGRSPRRAVDRVRATDRPADRTGRVRPGGSGRNGPAAGDEGGSMSQGLSARRAVHERDGEVGVGHAFGTFGELLQGVLPNGGANFLVTFPIDTWATATFHHDADALDIEVRPAHKHKCRTVAGLVLAAAGVTGGGSWT
ncbi:hypothetical protein NKG94_02605 [Micromonospora sp. M12]